MVRQRLQLGRLSGPERRNTSSAPADLYFRPNISRPQLQTLTDFAPLSASLQRFLKDEVQADSDRAIREGQQQAIENPEIVARLEKLGGDTPETRKKAFEQEFSKLVREGKIEESASPLFQIGFAQASARQVMQGYRQNVLARLNEASRVTDEEGQPVAAADPNQILAEEFEKVQDSPALQNEFGRALSAQLKERTDAEFADRVGQVRGAEIQREHRRILTNELAEQLDTLSVKDEITREDLSELSAFIQDEVTARSVKDPRALVLEAGRLAVQRAANADPEEGIRLVEQLEELSVGGSRLGKDVQSGLELEKLKRDLHVQAERDLARKIQQEEARRAAVIQEQEVKWVGELNDAFDDPNASLTAISQRIAEEISQDPSVPEDVRGFVLEDLRRYTRNLENSRETSTEVFDAVSFMLADGDVQGARDYLRAIRDDDAFSITGRDYAALTERIEARGNLAPHIEQNPTYNQTVGRISQTRQRLQGFSPQAQRELDSQLQEDLRQFNADYAEFVESTAGQEGREKLHRDWLAERESTLISSINERVEERRGRRDEASRAITELHRTRQDASQLIDQAEATGALTPEEATTLRAQNDRAQDRTDLFRLNAFTSALNGVSQQLEVSEIGQDLQAESPSRFLQLNQELQARVQRKANAWLDENLGSVPPAQLQRRFTEALTEIQDEVVSELSDRDPAVLRARVQSGDTPAQAARAEQAVVRQVQEADSLLAATADPFRFNADSPALPKDPDVPESFYRSYAKVVQGTGEVNRAQLELRAQTEAFALLDRKDLSEDRKRESVQSLLKLSGISADQVLAGEVVLKSNRPDLDQRLQHLRNLSRVRPSEDVSNQLAELERIASREEVISLDGAEINPYTTPLFQTVQEIQFMKERRAADWARLLETLGVPDTAEDEAEFIGRQQDAVERLSRLPQS